MDLISLNNSLNVFTTNLVRREYILKTIDTDYNSPIKSIMFPNLFKYNIERLEWTFKYIQIVFKANKTNQ